eukprot:440146_1
MKRNILTRQRVSVSMRSFVIILIMFVVKITGSSLYDPDMDEVDDQLYEQAKLRDMNIQIRSDQYDYWSDESATQIITNESAPHSKNRQRFTDDPVADHEAKLRILVDMGLSPNVCENALLLTSNIDQAAHLALHHKYDQEWNKPVKNNSVTDPKVNQLMNLCAGCTPARYQNALQQTGNSDINAAVNWLYTNMNDEQWDKQVEQPQTEEKNNKPQVEEIKDQQEKHGPLQFRKKIKKDNKKNMKRKHEKMSSTVSVHEEDAKKEKKKHKKEKNAGKLAANAEQKSAKVEKKSKRKDKNDNKSKKKNNESA